MSDNTDFLKLKRRIIDYLHKYADEKTLLEIAEKLKIKAAK
jgi:hypothetical protein